MARPARSAKGGVRQAAEAAPLRDRERALATAANAATVETARAVAHAATLGWWQACAEAHGAGSLAPIAEPAGFSVADRAIFAMADARAFGHNLARLPVAEASAALGRLYTQALPPAHKARHGTFYTPSSLVCRLLDRAERAGHAWGQGHVIDPSCGGGAFMVEAASRMMAALSGADPAIVIAALASRLRGWDVDPFATWLASVSVEAVALPLVIASSRRLGAVAEMRDALGDFTDEAGRYALVMGNPPFGKVKDTPATRARFARSLHGHPNLYGLFTDLAVHLATPAGGIVAYLTPASYLAGRYFKALRRMLHENAPPATLDLVESRKDVFPDVLQEVVLSTFRRGGAQRPSECAIVIAGRGSLEMQPTGVLVLPKNPDAPWTLPRTTDDAAFVDRLRQMPARLADWGYVVSTGPLVWNRHKPRLHDEPGPGLVPVVWAESVTRDGRFVLKATRRNHAPWFQPTSERDPNLVTRPCVLVQRTTAKEQYRRLICAEMPAEVIAKYGKVTVENHLNMVRPDKGEPKIPVSAVAAFLATTTADRVLRCINASVAVSASELAAMPLPHPDAVIAALAEADPETAVRRLYELAE